MELVLQVLGSHGYDGEGSCQYEHSHLSPNLDYTRRGGLEDVCNVLNVEDVAEFPSLPLFTSQFLKTIDWNQVEVGSPEATSGERERERQLLM